MDSAELQDGTCHPRWDVLYSAAGFSPPVPETINDRASEKCNMLNPGGVTVLRLSPDMVVKYGPHVTITEAQSMIFVAEHTKATPIPKVFAYCTYGPLNRDIDDYGSLFDTYIFMSLVGTYMDELREIRSEPYIGSVNKGPVRDQTFDNFHVKGPFESEETFNETILDAYQANFPKRHIRSFLAGMLSQKRHSVCFTHADLRPQNIMVRGGSITGIIDWELSGWYPEYWEFAKALYVWRWQNDWVDYLTKALEPYYNEYAVHSFVAEALW
ncbi:Pc13g05000 [Penicillium rubens Wisconsin 54-1255]|uniref:Pc13g05000 protein n=1 Tax=Penicillium rubens (strain ATCC 28089 / DSM 1075 / NRRL 1951 / Wisconsin 54-1255) TaxID=500485 RepID=B6H2E0_PENRW|nr:Pc13g05000 [Penicillium rubens Wisconsin 54-1255]